MRRRTATGRVRDPPQEGGEFVKGVVGVQAVGAGRGRDLLKYPRPVAESRTARLSGDLVLQAPERSVADASLLREAGHE